MMNFVLAAWYCWPYRLWQVKSFSSVVSNGSQLPRSRATRWRQFGFGALGCSQVGLPVSPMQSLKCVTPGEFKMLASSILSLTQIFTYSLCASL